MWFSIGARCRLSRASRFSPSAGSCFPRWRLVQAARSTQAADVPPLLAPGIVTGALVVFVLSITDFVLSQVLTTVDDQTLPVYIYSGLRGAISPALGAVSALFIVVVALAFAAVLRLGKVERFLFRT